MAVDKNKEPNCILRSSLASSLFFFIQLIVGLRLLNNFHRLFRSTLDRLNHTTQIKPGINKLIALTRCNPISSTVEGREQISFGANPIRTYVLVGARTVQAIEDKSFNGNQLLPRDVSEAR